MADDLRGGSLQVCRLRVARLEATGEPDVGAGNQYVTDVLISLGTSPEIEEGEDVTLRNGCGDIIVNQRNDDQFTRLNLTMELAKPDPVLTQMLIGGTILLDAAEEVGYAYPAVGPAPPPDVSVEAWTKHIVAGDQDGDFPWIRWVFPKTQWRIGDRSLANEAMVTAIAGIALENANWGDGPQNDWGYASDRVLQYALDTEANLPAAGFGASAVIADVP